MNRRKLLILTAATVAGGLAAPSILRAAEPATTGETLARRISGSRTAHWQEHFDSIDNDAILADMRDRVLHCWGADGSYRIYPTSVPQTAELTRRGRTEVTLKRTAPDWRPTDSMLDRYPDLPRYVGPGPDNPLGVRALNLGWPAYRIHGTNDIRKIGRQSSDGCVGLYTSALSRCLIAPGWEHRCC